MEKIVYLSEQLAGRYEDTVAGAIELVCDNSDSGSTLKTRAQAVQDKIGEGQPTEDYSDATPLSAQSFALKYGTGPRP